MQVLSHAPSRYVLLVVGDARDSIAGRLRDATIGAELVCCPSSEGAWSALASGRRYSAVVASGSDPDLTQAAERTGTPVVTVGHRSSPAELAAAIGAVAALVPRVDRPPDLGPASRPESSPDGSRRQGRLVAVCGPGGT
ncbi:MAG: hypothetical protein M3256_25675, partial [Actinomycetota bacterium]|nr:hypothetical protein [Actinomycetota bacterium]